MTTVKSARPVMMSNGMYENENTAEVSEKRIGGPPEHALGPNVGDASLTEADPRAQSTDEPVVLGHRIERVDDFPVEEGKVSGVQRHRHVRGGAKHSIERLVGELQEERRIALDPNAIDNVKSRLPLLVERLDQLGWILQVTIEQHRGVARCDRHTARERALRAEISRVVDDDDVGVPRCKVGQNGRRVVGTTVVDENDLVVHPELLEHGREPRVHDGDGRLVAITRDDRANSLGIARHVQVLPEPALLWHTVRRRTTHACCA